MMKKLLLIALVIIETVFAVWFAAPLFMGIVGIGSIFGAGFFVFLIVITLLHKKISALRKRKFGFIINILGIFLALCVVYAAVLSSFMIKAAVNVSDDANTIIVLGCQVRSTGKVSLMLSKRLDAAYEYLIDHPDCSCIVSGGQGKNEPVSEAQAMYDYLVEKGIDGSRIYMENKSFSTDENIRFSYDLIKSVGLNADNIAIVTDAFHQYRASIYAERNGLSVSAVSAETPIRLFPTYWVREWFGITAIYLNIDQALSSTSLN